MTDSMMREARNTLAEAIDVEFLKGTDSSWKKPPLINFISKTGTVVSPDTMIRDRELALWGLQYVAPHMGIPGSRVAQNFVKMADAGREGGSVYGAKGTRAYAEIPWLTDDNPLKSATAYVWGSLFGVKAVDERTTIEDTLSAER
jgi:hypothetical protein